MIGEHFKPHYNVALLVALSVALCLGLLKSMMVWERAASKDQVFCDNLFDKISPNFI